MDDDDRLRGRRARVKLRAFAPILLLASNACGARSVFAPVELESGDLVIAAALSEAGEVASVDLEIVDEGGASGSCAISGRTCRFERIRELADAVEIEVARQRGETAAERGIHLVAG